VVTLSDAVRSVGESVVAVHFETDPEALADRLPDPFESIRPGEAFLYVGEAVIRDPDIVDAYGYLPPRLSTLFEAGVVIPCELDGRKGGFFVEHHADRDWSARKFREMGYSSKLADIHLTRFPGELREFVSPDAGRTVRAKATKHGTTPMAARVTLEEPAEHPWREFAFTVFGRREIEDELTTSGPALLANDVTAESHTRAEMESVRSGSAEIDLHPDYFGDLLPLTVKGGYFFEFSLGFEGMNVLWEGPRE
jgi:hypothetical protein